MKIFKEILTLNLKSCKKNKFKDNYDFRRFGKIKKKFIKNLIDCFHTRQQIWNNIEDIDWLYNQLDKESKNLLVQIMSYRILKEKHVKLPLNTPEYWKKLEELDLLSQTCEKIDIGFNNWFLSKINLKNEGYPVTMFIRPSGVYAQMILEQYKCEATNVIIEVEKGDIVIDGGACYGDTAINFSYRTGTTGRVYSWEFMPDNINIFKRNMRINPEYAKQIELVENPLWSSSGKTLYVSGAGPAARVDLNPPKDIDQSIMIITYTIDDLCRDKNLNSIDFIKMDIEGAELEALKGAVVTIRKFKPKLAISVYHNLKDFWEIAQWINSLDLGYEFHLRHFTIHAEETVLFAKSKKN